MQRKRGSTSNMIRVFIQDNSVTTGAGLTGLTSASTNLQITTRRELDTSGTIYTGANIEEQTTVGTYQAPSTSAKIRFKAVDATNQPGLYELQFHNSAAGAFGSGDASRYMQIYIFEITTTALKIAPCLKEIELVAYDADIATNLGLSAIPTANPGAASGLFIAGTNAPVTITGSGNALTLTSTGANGHGLAANGNGTGDGFHLLGGNGGGGDGIHSEGGTGANSRGIHAQGGSTSGSGIRTESAAGNTPGILSIGTGTGSGLQMTGGGTSGNGMLSTGGGTGHGISAVSGGGATGNGINASSAATAGNGMALVKAGTGKNLDVTTENEISNNLLDQVNTGATHNIANSAGKQIRQASGNVPVAIRTGTCQTGSTANTIKLDSGASATNDIYVGCIVFLTGGTGLGQTRTIVAYNGTTKVATVDTNWVTTPTNTSTFEIDASANSLVSTEGTCQGGAASSITLASTASATNNLYNGSFVTILSGTGAGQTRVITAYNGTTKVATVDSAWSVDPVGSDSTYAVIPAGNVSPPQTFTAPSAAEIVQALLGTVLISRDLTAVTAPTVQDSLAASAAGAAGAEAFTGTTLTLKFLDGSTLRTFAVDSASAPTSRT